MVSGSVQGGGLRERRVSGDVVEGGARERRLSGKSLLRVASSNSINLRCFFFSQVDHNLYFLGTRAKVDHNLYFLGIRAKS